MLQTNSANYKLAQISGNSLVGKTAQSRLLTEINEQGKKVLSAPQLITSYEIVEEFMQPAVMAIIGGVSIHEEFLINIK